MSTVEPENQVDSYTLSKDPSPVNKQIVQNRFYWKLPKVQP